MDQEDSIKGSHYLLQNDQNTTARHADRYDDAGARARSAVRRRNKTGTISAKLAAQSTKDGPVPEASMDFKKRDVSAKPSGECSAGRVLDWESSLNATEDRSTQWAGRLKKLLVGEVPQELREAMLHERCINRGMNVGIASDEIKSTKWRGLQVGLSTQEGSRCDPRVYSEVHKVW